MLMHHGAYILHLKQEVLRARVITDTPKVQGIRR
jgi:hypothetical protein